MLTKRDSRSGAVKFSATPEDISRKNLINRIKNIEKKLDRIEELLLKLIDKNN